MRVTSRYLFPPMLKTTQFPTRLADPKSAFTSAQECHVTLLWLTCVCHARNGPFESASPGFSQNSRSLVFEMIRIGRSFFIDPRDDLSSQNTNNQGESSQNTNRWIQRAMKTATKVTQSRHRTNGPIARQPIRRSPHPAQETQSIRMKIRPECVTPSIAAPQLILKI